VFDHFLYWYVDTQQFTLSLYHDDNIEFLNHCYAWAFRLWRIFYLTKISESNYLHLVLITSLLWLISAYVLVFFSIFHSLVIIASCSAFESPIDLSPNWILSNYIELTSTLFRAAISPRGKAYVALTRYGSGIQFSNHLVPERNRHGQRLSLGLGCYSLFRIRTSSSHYPLSHHLVNLSSILTPHFKLQSLFLWYSLATSRCIWYFANHSTYRSNMQWKNVLFTPNWSFWLIHLCDFSDRLAQCLPFNVKWLFSSPACGMHSIIHFQFTHFITSGSLSRLICPHLSQVPSLYLSNRI